MKDYREFEAETNFSLSTWSVQELNRDYSEVKGSEELREYFKLLRVGGVFSPFRQYVWSEGRWYVSPGGWEGFYLNMVEAENITFEELYYNLALARGRQNRHLRTWDNQKNAMMVSDHLKENGI